MADLTVSYGYLDDLMSALTQTAALARPTLSGSDHGVVLRRMKRERATAEGAHR